MGQTLVDHRMRTGTDMPASLMDVGEIVCCGREGKGEQDNKLETSTHRCAKPRSPRMPRIKIQALDY